MLHRLGRVLRLGRVHSYESHRLAAVQHDRVAVHHPDAPAHPFHRGVERHGRRNSRPTLGRASEHLLLRGEVLAGKRPPVAVVAAPLPVVVAPEGVKAAAAGGRRMRGSTERETGRVNAVNLVSREPGPVQ